MSTHYRASNGQHKLIAGMPTPYLANALAKLQREEPHRTEEIDAMRTEHNSRQDREGER